ncbi:G2 and S phase-expressed protein 1 isoform X4 [Heterocephalus glaber]|uniref:G2 and S phase-expressed protein 1 isoform X4 n=1 Tax=Heterocephalus glaber TaxID=10181 RepID=A0AAX6QU60_HETGA|nr:G2 and S phase-expressed protein 1 isoform X4 [Heterocephalus glaber]
MDVAKKEDVLLLADEKFDFDLSLSSSSANEDDEVFFGPVGHRERCIAASLELNNQVPSQPASAGPASACAWSPLTGEKFVEVYKEAHLLALQIESQSRAQAAPAAQPEKPWSQGMERFVQESKLKMSLFEKEEETEKSPKSLKRETYYLSESPLVGTPLLLSGGQPPSAEPLLPAPALSLAPSLAPGPASPAPAGQHSSHLWPGDSRAVHPPGQAMPQKRAPSKLPAPRALAARGRLLHLASEKLKKEVPGSPSRGKLLNEKQLHGAGLPDKPRAVLDAPGLLGTGGHRGQGKRLLPVPSKVGLKKSLLKPPGCASSITGKSSSSSGSSSSTTSSVCPSPAAGKGGSPNSMTPKFSRAQRLQSWASAGRVMVHSTPVRRSSGPASQSPPGSTRTPMSARRMSALPTPASRRLSGLPLMTPRTMPRALSSPLFVPARRLSSEPRRRSEVGTEPARDSGRGPGRGQVAPSPSGVFSPPPSVPHALCFSPEKSIPFPEGPATGPAQDEAKRKEDTHPTEVVDTAVLDRPPLRGPAQALLVDIGLDQLAISPPAARPLIALGSTPGADVPSGPVSGPLIDLTTSTPDMNRHGVSKAVPAEGQLIDLCSPLIQLSPEADKENLDSPLLKF